MLDRDNAVDSLLGAFVIPRFFLTTKSRDCGLLGWVDFCPAIFPPVVGFDSVRPCWLSSSAKVFRFARFLAAIVVYPDSLPAPNKAPEPTAVGG
jgi:hypothetical protein